MKTAIYIEDGTVQLVITPETEFEKNAISTMREKPLDAKIFDGTFYDCRGGWIRQNNFHRENTGFGATIGSANDKSLIIRVNDNINTPEAKG